MIAQMQERMEEIVTNTGCTVQNFSELVPKNDVNECFRCPICTEVKYEVVFCNTCSQRACCGVCLESIDRCPLCRGEFSISCNHCEQRVPLRPKPFTILGLQNLCNNWTSGCSYLLVINYLLLTFYSSVCILFIALQSTTSTSATTFRIHSF